MKRATVVIGAAFGDEGKGLMVDYHAARLGAGTVVVRFNGGAQAGHTVQTPDGRWHVFSHFGSGTFACADTFLSRHFLVNPILWRNERNELARKLPAGFPNLFIDPAASVSTPYDMIVNKEIEIDRGAARHGSCGMGINETIRRVEAGLEISVVSLGLRGSLESKVDLIRKYAINTLERRGIYKRTAAGEDALKSERTAKDFVEACEEMRSHIQFVAATQLRYVENIVFEGAQGLLLDEKHRFFPHVTRSRTGITNVLSIAGSAGVTDLDVDYVLRSYMTRHGAGPFPCEDPEMSFEDITNDPDEFQGVLRFGRIDTRLVREAITSDLEQPDVGTFKVNPGLAITHLDQTDGKVLTNLSTGGVSPNVLADYLGIGRGYLVSGPTREGFGGFHFDPIRRSA